jgi:iron-sulfur cluster repair protein YtfE (RIC family)
MTDDLDLHMRKEELVLFPAIEQLEREAPESSGLTSQIRTVLSEHDSTAKALTNPQNHTRLPASGARVRQIPGAIPGF